MKPTKTTKHVNQFRPNKPTYPTETAIRELEKLKALRDEAAVRAEEYERTKKAIQRWMEWTNQKPTQPNQGA